MNIPGPHAHKPSILTPQRLRASPELLTPHPKALRVEDFEIPGRALPSGRVSWGGGFLRGLGFRGFRVIPFCRMYLPRF